MEIFPLTQTDFGPAAKALVEKIASATGTLYAPLGTILQAYADVSSDKIRAKGEIEVELEQLVRRRVLERLVAEETKEQNNLEATYDQAFQLRDSKADIAKIRQMDDDWIVFHSKKARLVSDKEMQTLWARVLASESEVPGSFSKRALELLSVLEKTEAHLFTLFCRFVVRQNSEPIPAVLIHPDWHILYTDLGLDTETLIHLGAIGLVQVPGVRNNNRLYDAPTVDLEYFGDHRTFQISKTWQQTRKYMFPYGHVDLTKVGRELAGIAGAEPVEGFFDFLEAEWAKEGISRQLKTTR